METDIDDVTIHIRHATPDDLQSFLRIERDTTRFPWTEGDFRDFFAKQDHAIFVAERGKQVIGFVACDLCLGSLMLRHIAVAEEFLRRGVGSRLFDFLTATLRPDGVRSIFAFARETDDARMSFLLKLGFQPVKVVRDHFNIKADGFRFQWKLSGGSDKANGAALNPGSKMF